MDIDKRKIKKGSLVPCTHCGKPVYKMQSKIYKYNFCCDEHRVAYLKSSENTSMSKGWHHGDEARAKITQANLEKNYNVIFTDESRKKMADTARERVWTDEQREGARQRKLGKKNTREQNRKIKKHAIYGKENKAWKGDFASYYAMHAWVVRHKGKAKKCVDRVNGSLPCKGRFEWMNIDHKYQRILDDYIERCTRHHRKYDIVHNNYKVFNRVIKKRK